MRQRGRKSAEALAINVSGEPPRLTPPAGLSPKERAAFVELVNAADPRHFRRSDVPMIVALVQATIKARELGRDPSKTQDWERASRVMMALATKLRLTPQCRTRPESIARMQQLGVGGTPLVLIGLTPAPGSPMKIVGSVYGAQPYPAFKSALDAVLAQAK